MKGKVKNEWFDIWKETIQTAYNVKKINVYGIKEKFIKLLLQKQFLFCFLIIIVVKVANKNILELEPYINIYIKLTYSKMKLHN